MSGFAGTMMSQLTLSAAVTGAVTGAVAVAAGLGEPLPEALGEGDAVAPAAACWIVVCCVPPERASMTPSVRPSAIGMASGIARRAARLRG